MDGMESVFRMHHSFHLFLSYTIQVFFFFLHFTAFPFVTYLQGFSFCQTAIKLSSFFLYLVSEAKTKLFFVVFFAWKSSPSISCTPFSSFLRPHKKRQYILFYTPPTVMIKLAHVSWIKVKLIYKTFLGVFTVLDFKVEGKERYLLKNFQEVLDCLVEITQGFRFFPHPLPVCPKVNYRQVGYIVEQDPGGA